MKTKIAIGSVSFLLLAVSFISCLKKKEFPIRPNIRFKKFIPSGNAGELYINFTDGDGNIGLADGDTNPPYHSGTAFYYNLFLDYYEKQNGVWVKRDLNPPFYYRVPILTPSGQNKTLDGEIKVKMEPYFFDPSSDFDTIRFQVRLADRDLNVSPEIMTDEIITP